MKLRLAALAALTVLLAACGGGESQVNPFEPTRALVFGDELSALTADGKRWGVNGFKTVNEQQVHDCTANPVWVQAVMSRYGLVPAECNPENKTVTAKMYAAAGAKVADVRAQIDQHIATGGGLGPKDLALLMAGQNDVLELYAQFPTQTENQLRAAAAARGRALADQANRIANANGRVLVQTMLNQGLTPFALSEKANNTDTNRAALLTALTEEFNRALRLGLINDGRLIGLVLADENVDLIASFPSAFGLSNATQAACAVALPNCSTSTLVTDAGVGTWMWADATRPSAVVQTQMATQALTRLANLPF